VILNFEIRISKFEFFLPPLHNWIAQHAQSFNLYFRYITRFHVNGRLARIANTGWCAGKNEVPRFQRTDL
jgi:hypothetical protein